MAASRERESIWAFGEKHVWYANSNPIFICLLSPSLSVSTYALQLSHVCTVKITSVPIDDIGNDLFSIGGAILGFSFSILAPPSFALKHYCWSCEFREIKMKILNCLIVIVGVIVNQAAAARKQPAIDTRRYANICLHRVPIKENDSRGHAILKTAIEVSSLSSILSRESPQHKAMCWMLYDDPVKLNPRSNRGRFLDRYGLVTFYLNTKGPGWVRSDNWLSKESECSWYGIKCNGSMPGLSSRVTGVDLSFNKVSGWVTIHPWI